MKVKAIAVIEKTLVRMATRAAAMAERNCRTICRQPLNTHHTGANDLETLRRISFASVLKRPGECGSDLEDETGKGFF